ncbi:MAG: 2-C-methyl-D-erythritol 2,4-cyclodiphosphate synthase [Planctomycetota bacterium]|nr:2-C-methyl-D-erythritol 2,4-cyclodiphosphate synthase [Planctomycetota bacterium]
MFRMGLGTDRHRLVFGKKLILGGVKIDSPKGAVGHSDADTLTHAVIDAILGAAGMGDIGHHFPDTDPQWEGADSIELLKKCVEILQHAGYRAVNIDAVVQLEQPKLGRFKQEMAGNIAAALKLPRHMVNVKAKTGEGVGLVGTGEVVEAQAVACVEKLGTMIGRVSSNSLPIVRPNP